MNKLSHSSVFLYNQCSLCYDLKYNQRVRPVKTKSAFIFGHALDCAFNSLLKERNLDKAKRIFLYRMKNAIINDKRVDVENTNLVIYTKNDTHLELLDYFNALEHPNLPWRSLCLKGMLIVKAYHDEVLPKIKKVLSIQKRIALTNIDGDKINGLLDAVVVWEDGKTYLIDNKSSTVKYEKDSVNKSDQLALYHYIEKDNIPLDGAGFVVLDKNINMNKKKTCEDCGVVNTGSHRTCNETVETPHLNSEYGRCGGKFTITYRPTVEIEYFFSPINPEDEERVIELFDAANHNIANGIYATEHNPVFSKFGPCEYYKYYEGNPDFFIKEKR